MSSTPHRGARGRAISTGALVATAAMLSLGIQTEPASARPDGTGITGTTSKARFAEPDPGAMAARLSPAQRTELMRAADDAKSATARELGLGNEEKLVVRDVVKDADGTTHTRYERAYAGLPVLGGDLVVHEKKSGQTEGVTTSYQPRLKVTDLSAEVTAETAERQAVRTARAEGSTESEADHVRKVIWTGGGKPVLAYETVVGGLQHDGTPQELHVVTDAQTGRKLHEYEAVHTGTGNTRYGGTVTLGTSRSGSAYTLTDASRGNHRTYNLDRGTSGTGTLFSGDDDVWGDGTTTAPETAGADAHYGAALTWDYYKNVHGRNGLRGDGVAPRSRVHYGDDYVNAFWQESCFCATYGDGAGNANPLTAVDVVAHEMSHGLTQATARLNYSGESGGLNEATSDILAAAVEFDADNASDVGDYLVGEEIDINGDRTPLRYMDRPSRDGASADYWSSSVGGMSVHRSSGPANHWFYLASEGSGAKTVNGVSYNSPTYDGRPVAPIGRENAAKIWFRALTVYMTSTTNYAGARAATLQAAEDLFGRGSVTYNNTFEAWGAVNVGPRLPDGVTVTAPAGQHWTVGRSVGLQVQATSTHAGALRYVVSGLPAGLSVSSSTGLLSGSPATAGSGTATVTVTDSAGEKGEVGFAWVVDPEGQGRIFENTANYPIPDDSVVESPIDVDRAGAASRELRVDLDITHTFVGDLVIDLIAPSGTAYRLKNASADSSDGWVDTRWVDASSETAKGTWKLRVADVSARYYGHINSWRLTF